MRWETDSLHDMSLFLSIWPKRIGSHLPLSAYIRPLPQACTHTHTHTHTHTRAHMLYTECSLVCTRDAQRVTLGLLNTWTHRWAQTETKHFELPLPSACPGPFHRGQGEPSCVTPGQGAPSGLVGPRHPTPPAHFSFDLVSVIGHTLILLLPSPPCPMLLPIQRSTSPHTHIHPHTHTHRVQSGEPPL